MCTLANALSHNPEEKEGEKGSKRGNVARALTSGSDCSAREVRGSAFPQWYQLVWRNSETPNSCDLESTLL